MKRTWLQRNTNTDEQSRWLSGSCDTDSYRHHPAEISFKEQHFDPKEILQVKSFVRMKAKLLLPVLLVMLVTVSCKTSLLETKIDPANLIEVIGKIRTELPNLETEKKDVLKLLETIHSGKEAYQAKVTGTVVDTYKFNMYKEQLFNFFLSRGTTYGQLFDEVGKMKEFDQKFEGKIYSMHQKIDDFCVNKQKELDQKENQVQQIISQLSQKINVNILNINKARYFQQESVDVLMQIKNTTRTPIESASFNVYIYRGGSMIARLPIVIDDRFVSNKMKQFKFGKSDYPAIFNALKNADVYSLTLKVEAYKMNIDGKTFDAYAITKGLKNHKYKKEGELKGECPYLTEDEVLYKEMDDLMIQKEKEFAEAIPCMGKIEYITKSLIEAQS